MQQLIAIKKDSLKEAENAKERFVKGELEMKKKNYEDGVKKLEELEKEEETAKSEEEKGKLDLKEAKEKLKSGKEEVTRLRGELKGKGKEIFAEIFLGDFFGEDSFGGFLFFCGLIFVQHTSE